MLCKKKKPQKKTSGHEPPALSRRPSSEYAFEYAINTPKNIPSASPAHCRPKETRRRRHCEVLRSWAASAYAVGHAVHTYTDPRHAKYTVSAKHAGHAGHAKRGLRELHAVPRFAGAGGVHHAPVQQMNAPPPPQGASQAYGDHPIAAHGQVHQSTYLQRQSRGQST